MDQKLLQAAFSHLDLALVNLCEQARSCELNTADRHVVCAAATKLQQLSEIQASPVMLDMNVSTLKLQETIDGPGFEKFNFQEAPRSIDEAWTSVDHKKIEAVEDAAAERENGSDSREDSGHREACAWPLTSQREERGSPREEYVQTMLKIARDEFDERDKSCTFTLKFGTLKVICMHLDFQEGHVQNVLSSLQRNSADLVYVEEWSSIVQNILDLHETDEIIKMIQNVHRKRLGVQESLRHHNSRSFDEKVVVVKHHFIISQSSLLCMVWGLLMMILLVYVALALPLTFAFDDVSLIHKIDQVVDWIFFCDLILTFRTTFINENREEIFDWKAIALRYLRTWFLLDFFTSFPLEQVSAGFFPRLQPAKILKFGKVLKACKMLRLTKMSKILSGELADRLEEFMWSQHLLVVSHVFSLLLKMAFMGHWFACMLLACRGGSVEAYSGPDTSSSEKYLVAMYWAIMAMTTVGYGDLTLQTGLERVCGILVMIVGGGFYGYIIGCVTTILSHQNAERQAFNQRMEGVITWLNSHYELSAIMRRMIWKHFKESLKATQPVPDSLILNDLPPDLCDEVTQVMLQESVRIQPLFQTMSVRGWSKIVSALSKVLLQAGEVIVDEGSAGHSMFIIDSGVVCLTQGGTSHRLSFGASFGDEVVMGRVAHYRYSAKSRSKVCMFRIERDLLLAGLEDLPQDIKIMQSNFENVEGGCLFGVDRSTEAKSTPGLPSLSTGGVSGMPPAFPSLALEQFGHLTKKMDRLLSKQVVLQGLLGKLKDGGLPGLAHMSKSTPQDVSCTTDSREGIVLL